MTNLIKTIEGMKVSTESGYGYMYNLGLDNAIAVIRFQDSLDNATIIDPDPDVIRDAWGRFRIGEHTQADEDIVVPWVDSQLSWEEDE